MGTKFDKTSKEWNRGRNGEILVNEKLLRPDGWFVIPTTDYSGEDNSHAPVGYAPDGKQNIVLTDLYAMKEGKSKLAEVKTKARPTVTFKLGNLVEHGMSLRNYNHYVKLQRESGLDVWVFCYCINDGLVCANSISFLTGKGRIFEGPNAPDNGGSIFFPRKLLIPHYLGLYVTPESNPFWVRNAQVVRFAFEVSNWLYHEIACQKCDAYGEDRPDIAGGLVRRIMRENTERAGSDNVLKVPLDRFEMPSFVQRYLVEHAEKCPLEFGPLVKKAKAMAEVRGGFVITKDVAAMWAKYRDEHFAMGGQSVLSGVQNDVAKF